MIQGIIGRELPRTTQRALVVVFRGRSVLRHEDSEVSGFVMQARRNIPTVPQPSETIRLVKAFLTITCASERERLMAYAECVAAEHSNVDIIEVTVDIDEDDV